MATLTYRGRTLDVNSGKDLYEIVQLLLTDLGAVGDRLAAKEAQDGNRDRWLQQFAQWTGAQVARLSQNGQQGILPLSITSLFASKAKALTAPTASTAQTPAPAPAAPVSPHRVTPGPQGAGLATSLASITAVSGSTDRAHRFALDFTAAYNGTTNVAEVSFHTPYPSPPVVILQQEDTLPNRNFHCVSVSTTGYVFMCDDFGGAEAHVVQALVIHPSDPAD